jgi:L-lactate dehydrogenase complex protein LldG
MGKTFAPPGAVAEISARRRQKLARYPGLGKAYLEARRAALRQMDALVEKAMQTLRAKKCEVHLAAGAAEARELILNLVDAPMVVKSRSLALEEIGVVPALRAKGVEVVETALGDFVLQLAGVLPAWHLSEKEILNVLKSGLGVTGDLRRALGGVREHLRRYLAGAAYGLTGANAVVAENGSLVIMEDEGNARAVSNLPHTHIAVVGIEKIVPDQESAMTVCRAAAVYGTGQDLGNYLSIITGPSSTGDIQGKQVFGMHGPRRVIVILLDNGRRRCLESGFEELLYCNNCGACLEVCPVFPARGPAYGHHYPGGRGAVFAAFTGGIAAAREAGVDLCQSCGKCREACPAGINTPELIKRLSRK